MKLARTLACLAAVLLAVVVHRHHTCDDCIQHLGMSCDDNPVHEDCHGLCDLDPVASHIDRDLEPRLAGILDVSSIAPHDASTERPRQIQTRTRRIRPPPGSRHRLRARHRIDGRGCILLQ